MKKILIILISLTLNYHIYSQDLHFSQFNQTPSLVNPALTGASSNWTATNIFEQKNFIENKGQVDANKLPNKQVVLYIAHIDGVTYYFTKNGYTISHIEREQKSETEREKAEEKEKHQHGKKEGKEEEEKEMQFKITEQFHELKWLGANPLAEVITGNKVTNYYSYSDPKDKKVTIIARAYTRLTYKEIYPNTDIVFEFPKDSSGIKYSIYIHPGADVEKVRMSFPNETCQLTNNKDLEILSELGKIIDHQPTSYAAENKSSINSSFTVSTNQIGFELTEAPKDKTIIIDPWTVTPTFDTSSRAFDIDYDNAGNVYAYGGILGGPFVLCKYDNTGTLLWSYTPTFSGTFYYGDFAVDRNSGNIYVVEGFNNTTGANVIKINSTAALLATFGGDLNFMEMWRIAFSRCTDQAVIAGGGASSITYQTCYLDTNLTSLSPVSYVAAGLPGGNDVALLALDNYSNCYEVSASNADGLFDNQLVKMPLPALTPLAYNVNTGYSFIEVGTPIYYGGGTGSGSQSNGYNGITTSNKYVYTYDSYVLKKWDGPTGNLLTYKRINYPNDFTDPFGGPTIPDDSSKVYWGGISADDCGNLFVSDSNLVLQYDSTLTLVNSYLMPGVITDINFSTTDQLYVCGLGFVSSLRPTGMVNCFSRDSSITTTVSAIGATCNTPGSAAVSVTGGNAPYTIIWNTLPVQYGDTATNLTPGSYSFIVMDNSCLRNKFIDSVVVPALGGAFISTPVISAGCPGIGGSITITNSGGILPYNYTWTHTTTDTNAVYSLSSDSYSVIITDSAGCTNVFSALSVEPATVTHYSFTGKIKCFNDTTTLTIIPTDGIAPYTVNWTTPVASGTSHIFGTHAGNFIGSITDGNGCVQPFNYTLTEPSSVFTAFSTSSYNCAIANFGSIVVSQSGGDGPYSYSWSGSTETSNTRIPIASGIYTVTVKDSNQCAITLTDTIPVYRPVNISAVTIETCLGGSYGSVTTTTTGGAAGSPYEYSWTGFPADSTNILTNVGVGTYTITVTSGSCTGIASFNVNQLPVTTTTVPANICTGQTYTLPSGILANTTGTYTDTVSTAAGCDSIVNTVLTVIIPLANAGLDTTISYGSSTILTPSGGTSYNWSPSNALSCVDCTNPVVSPLQTTTYTMTATNEKGCTGTDQVTVFVDPPPCVGALVNLATLIPNAFSPNDDALNDELCIPANPCIAGITLVIYDRWGEKVYEGNDIKDCWDGIYKGKKLESAVFAYYITVQFLDGTTQTGKGNISLVK